MVPFAAAGPSIPGAPMVSELGWRAMILPQMEGGTAYNAINFSISSNMINNGAQFTSYNTVFTTWLCPSDGTNGGGRPPSQYSDRPVVPSGPSTPRRDNRRPDPDRQLCRQLRGQLLRGAARCTPVWVWETPVWWSPPVGQPRIGWNGYWGTGYGLPGGFTAGSGTMRGYFDYRSTQKPPNIAAITDGTSNTIMAGEVMPSAAADSNFWYFNGGYAGTTVPLGWNANTYPAAAANCLGQWQNSTAPNGCRYSAAAKGFVSLHPGGSNMLFGDGSVHFLKNSINLNTYCALGSRAGGEVVHVNDGRLVARRAVDGRTESFPLDYGIGSGNHGVTFVALRSGAGPGLDPAGVEHRLSYLAHDRSVVVTPGQQGPAGDRLEPRDVPWGKSMRPDAIQQCFKCHSTLTSTLAANRLETSTMIPNVSCERCHGPGRSHIEAARRGQDGLTTPM